MSSQDHGFSPVSYHNGSVWPHDNAIAAAGLARYGYRDHAGDIAVAVFEAAEQFEEHRLPEVYSGHPRSEAVFPVWYPQAACPRAGGPAAGPASFAHRSGPPKTAARRRSRSPDHRHLAGLSPVPAASRCTC